MLKNKSFKRTVLCFNVERPQSEGGAQGGVNLSNGLNMKRFNNQGEIRGSCWKTTWVNQRLLVVMVTNLMG